VKLGREKMLASECPDFGSRKPNLVYNRVLYVPELGIPVDHIRTQRIKKCKFLATILCFGTELFNET